MLALGERYFRGIFVRELTFVKAAEALGVPLAFSEFLRSFGFCGNAFTNGQAPDELHLEITDEESHSFTVPLGFAVSREAEIFLDFSAEIHFGPDVIRSVVGVIDSLANLHVDRAMAEASEHGFGLAFGPLSGVLSRDGKYFDRFHTYATGAVIRDFLASATVDTVGVRIGIFFSHGKVAFFRLPEEDGDWETTGFVYEMGETQNFLYPCLMFSRVSQHENVFFQLRGISDRPPYTPHLNEEALDYENNWLPFEEDALDILRQQDDGEEEEEDAEDEEVDEDDPNEWLGAELERRRPATFVLPTEFPNVFGNHDGLIRQLQQFRDRYVQHRE
jgi:hypothetical protein